MSDSPYMSGWGNEFSSEAIAGSLPLDKNNPQTVKHGLYAEQLSGSAFTAPNDTNLRSWLYKLKPSAEHTPPTPCQGSYDAWCTPGVQSFVDTPERLRWGAYASVAPSKQTVFSSMFTVAANGDARQRSGSAIHLYAADQSMQNEAFQNSDAEMLIVPQAGTLEIQTELGYLEIAPCEIAVIPRGLKCRVQLKQDSATGYICENFGAPFGLPYKGPIGANGLASRRHFLAPRAAYEAEAGGSYQLVTKYQGGFWQTQLATTPFDVVAWFGNYVPYKYDLNLFNTMGTISYDHPDPSIFTVLTSPSHQAGTANVDFVIFPPRWLVAEDTFRPPYFHRNIMSEYMGLIKGVYDAKPSSGGFQPGGGSLHNCMSAHGPELRAYEKAVTQELKPQKLDRTMAFMFESSWVYRVAAQALDTKILDKEYTQCWQGFSPAQIS